MHSRYAFPSVLMRCSRPWDWGVGIVAVASAGLYILRVSTGTMPSVLIQVLWGSLCIGVMAVYITQLCRGKARLIRLARQHDYLLCTECGYPLQGLGDEGQCPECATPFEAKFVRRLWRLNDSRRAIPASLRDEQTLPTSDESVASVTGTVASPQSGYCTTESTEGTERASVG